MSELPKIYRSISAYIYFGLLTILAVSLSFSVYVVSLCEIGLLINFILEGEFKKKLRCFLEKKSLLIFLSIFLVHILWLAGTSDFKFAFENLRIKMPLLLLPVIITLSRPLDADNIKLLLKFFVASVLTGTLIGTTIYLGFTHLRIDDVRQISIFISHIRFSLLIVIAILVLIRWIFEESFELNLSQLSKLLIVIWLIVFLVILKSFTGLIVLTVTVFILILKFNYLVKFRLLRSVLLSTVFLIPFITVIWVLKEINEYNNIEKFDLKKIESRTIGGSLYANNPQDWNVENGHRVGMYLCESELRREWNKRSIYQYDSFDMKNQPVAYTLIRYMTSKGLRKDSTGVSKLDKQDISNVEQGITNIIYTNKLGLKPRLYEIIWEFDQFRHGLGANRHSVTQRIIYSEVALFLIKSHFWFGVGTGDLPNEYALYYKTHDTGLSYDRQLHTHNQFLRLMVLFGFFGFVIIMLALILPPFIEKKWSSYYFVMIFTIILLSFLNEDTLETQIGVTFAVFFYSLFLWGTKKKTENDF